MRIKSFCPKKLCNSLAHLSSCSLQPLDEDDVKLFKYPHVRLEGQRNPGE